MAKFRFQIKKHMRDDMYKTEFVEVDLTDEEYKTIKSDDGKYSKASSLLSSKLGGNVQSLGLPSEIRGGNENKKDKSKSSKSKSSLWKPIWAMPFKLIWRLIRSFLPF